MMKPPAVFLDRDGTLNRQLTRDGLPYPPATVDEFELFPDAADACARLHAAGYVLVVATNQPDVGRGTTSRATVEAMHAKLQRLIPTLALIQTCFHAGKAHGQECDCRKPKPGMLLDAARRLDLDLASSWMIGDRWRDIDCGHAAGCKTIFIDHGYREALRQKPDHSVKALTEAANVLLGSRI
jgi:D-glycero-D-manno-heptose 1,7-bisphosphate phosphatase